MSARPIPDAAVWGRRCRLPDLPRGYSTESDPIQRLLAFAYLQAQRNNREAAEELQKDANILSAVLAAQSQIAAVRPNLEQALEFIAEQARRLTGAGGAAIALREGQNLVCRGRAGLLAPALGASLNPDSGISGACLRAGEVQLCEDTEHDRRVDVWACRNLGLRSVLAVPLRRQQDVLGIIVVFSGWAGIFGEREIRALKLLTGLVIEALWSHEAHAPAPETPPLTAQPMMLTEAAAARPTPPAAPLPEIAQLSIPVGTPAEAPAELPAPAFAVLGITEPLRMLRILVIIALALAALAGATEAVLWHGVHIRQLLGFKTAGTPRSVRSAAAPTPITPDSAPEAAANAVPGASSVPMSASRLSRLVSIRTLSKPEGTTVALFLQAPARWESGRLKEPERIYFDLENTQVAGELLGKSREGLAVPVNDGLVRRIRVSMRDASALRIVIELAAPAEYSAVLSSVEPYRLMIVIRGTQAPNSGPVSSEPAPSKKVPSAELRTPAPNAALSRHPRIVIDPGHGGAEEGAIGHGGLKEKDLVLDIAKRLGELLARRLDAEVIYTRTEDVAVPLEARATMANQAAADLFISIHANSSGDPNRRGVETYYVTNSPSTLGVKGSALKPVREDRKLSESRRLAVEVQQALYGASRGEKGVVDRGVKQAPFVVLLDAELPSILAEVAFVTSPTDEQKLSTAEGQQSIADALYRGIAGYLSSAKPAKMVASLPASAGQ